MFLQVWADGERDGELLAAVAVVPLGASSTQPFRDTWNAQLLQII